MSKVMEEVHLTTIKPKNNVLLLAQEISFAKVLACNDKRLRDRGVRRLKKWFMARSQLSMEFTKEDFLRIWKGLFYCMWMSDKPLIQEELAEEISNLIHSFATFKSSLMFVEAFFTSLSIEWFGIDQLRMDKFMMLVRRFLRQSLELVARLKWGKNQVQALADVYERALTSAPMGLSMHFIEIFCEELAKVGKGELSSKTISQFLNPFARTLATLKDGRLISQITRYVFLYLIRQTELGIEHQLKFSVWKEHGFPGGNLDAAEKIEVESDSDNEMLMDDSEEEREEERQVGPDARAGKVDVLLPPLDFDPHEVLKILVEQRNKKETTTKARKTFIQLISKFESLAAGKYPLGLHKVELPEKVDKKMEISKAAKQLIIDEQRIMHSDTEDSEDSSETHIKENRKKHKVKKQKSSAWEVSDSDSNVSHNESLSKSSWDVSESEATEKVKPKSKKRKNLEEDSSLVESREKKMKVSSFTVSDSKENSFSSPVASTPKKLDKNNILKKLSSNDQNVCDSAIKSTSKRISLDNQQNKSLKQKIKSKANKNGTLNLSDFEKRNSPKRNKNLKKEQSNINNCEKSIDQDKQVDRGDSTGIQLNTSTTEKNNGWGGDWDEPSNDVEYEIFIPNKKYVQKRKSLGLSYPVSAFFQKSAEKATPAKKRLQNKSMTPGSQKKVEFNLSANCSQDYKDYTKKVRRSKSKVPFDAEKKPVQGLLKNSTPSPINPFYKKKLKLLSLSAA